MRLDSLHGHFRYLCFYLWFALVLLWLVAYVSLDFIAVYNWFWDFYALDGFDVVLKL